MKALSLPTMPEKVSPPHTALLVVDMQHDYCGEGGAFARGGGDMTEIRALFSRFRSFLETARGRGVTIVIIGTFRDENDVSLPMREMRAKRGQKGTICQRGSGGTDFIPGVQPQAGDIIVEKKRYSAFFGTNLDEKTLLAEVCASTRRPRLVPPERRSARLMQHNPCRLP